MKLHQHVIISIGISALVGLGLKSWIAAAACFAAGVFIDLDHVFDYILNCVKNGFKPSIRHFFHSFEYEAFDYLVLLLHSWEFVPIWLALVWYLNWPPVLLGLLIGLASHLLLDQLFNKQAPGGYFLLYRIRYGFSGKHYLGAREYRKRMKKTKALRNLSTVSHAPTGERDAHA